MTIFLRTRGRPLAVGGCFLWVLALFVIATHLSAQLNVEEGGLVIAVLLMLAAIPFHWFGDRKNALYVVSLTLNAVGMGFSAGAYYSVTGLSAAFSALLPALLLPLFLLFLLCGLLCCLPRAKGPVTGVFLLLVIGLIVTSVVFWVKRGGAFYAFSLFSHAILLLATGVCIATVGEEDRVLLRDASFGGFGAFWAVAVAALLALALASGDGCDCDGGDCCDCSGCDCGSSGKKKKH